MVGIKGISLRIKIKIVQKKRQRDVNITRVQVLKGISTNSKIDSISIDRMISQK
jgi:hypothetical protein